MVSPLLLLRLLRLPGLLLTSLGPRLPLGAQRWAEKVGRGRVQLLETRRKKPLMK